MSAYPKIFDSWRGGEKKAKIELKDNAEKNKNSTE